MNRVLGVVLIIAALTTAIIPQFTDCESQGRALVLQNGNKVPMKCHWTSIAAIGAAVPLALAGLYMAFSRKKTSSTFVGVTGLAGGALAILFPTALIGVCANPDMICNMVMRPTLIASGIVAMAVSAIILARGVAAERARPEPAVKLAV